MVNFLLWIFFPQIPTLGNTNNIIINIYVLHHMLHTYATSHVSSLYHMLSACSIFTTQDTLLHHMTLHMPHTNAAPYAPHKCHYTTPCALHMPPHCTICPTHISLAAGHSSGRSSRTYPGNRHPDGCSEGSTEAADRPEAGGHVCYTRCWQVPELLRRRSPS